MLREKIFKILLLSLCLTMSSVGMAFADTRLAAPDVSVSSEVISDEVDPEVYDKQVQIDKVLFIEENLKLFEEKGIFITHTAPMDGYVEVGITPLNEENKEFVLQMLGEDKIQVVEGIQAVTFDSDLAATSEIMEANIASGNEEPAVEKDAKVTMAPLNNKEVEKSNLSPLAIGAGIVAVLGLGGALLKKKLA